MVERGMVHIVTLPMNELERTGNERRLAVQLLNYWDRIRGDRLFPSEKSIQPKDIPHLWDHCYLIRLKDSKMVPKADFTYLGSEIIKTYQELLPEEDAADIIAPHASRLTHNFLSVAADREPIMQSGEFVNGRGNTLLFRQCLLPLGETDEKVGAIFGCVKLKLRA